MPGGKHATPLLPANGEDGRVVCIPPTAGARVGEIPTEQLQFESDWLTFRDAFNKWSESPERFYEGGEVGPLMKQVIQAKVAAETAYMALQVARGEDPFDE